MLTRRTLSAAGGLAVLAALAVLQVQAADSAAEHRMNEHCARACSDCQRICDQCSTHCADLMAQGMKEHKKTLMTCQDCAEVCASASKIVSRGGPFADVICKACAETCARCGQACDVHGAHDKIMKACADECRKCEKACREMLKHTGSAQATAK